MDRERWLNNALIDLRAALADSGFRSAVDAVATCGWPSKLALARKQRIGECWDTSSSAAGRSEIFISPMLCDETEVLATLAHECVHAVVGIPTGHKGAFVKAVRALGLEGKPSATHAGPEFTKHVDTIVARLGKYPHAAMTPDLARKKAKQGTRMIKLTCEGCGYQVRTTRKWIDTGLPLCPNDGTHFQEDS